MKKESYGAGITLMKTKSSVAGPVITKRKAAKSEQCHFYDDFAVLIIPLFDFYLGFGTDYILGTGSSKLDHFSAACGQEGIRIITKKLKHYASP